MNAKIEKARNTALEILKPSEKELDHGLGLHKDSIVFDSYGFSPTSAWDTARFNRELEAGASLLELKQLGEEMSMMRHIGDKSLRDEYADAWNESGVTCVFQNAGQEGSCIETLLRRLGRFTHVIDSLPEILRRTPFPDDIEKAKKEGRHCLYLTGNGVPLRGREETVEDELSFIRTFFFLGIRMMHLTYNRRNYLGDGCGEPADGGLSDLGRRAIEEMNKIGVIVDVAHSALQTSMDAARASSKPMVASHSSCNAMHDHCRAKTDEVIKAIVDTGGYIGICCVPGIIGRSGDINSLLDHIDHVVEKFGADHVAIGADTGYTSMQYTSPVWPKGRSDFRSLWPENSFPDKYKEPHMKESLAWTNWPLYTVGLVQRGHSDEDIRKIIGGNVMRVIRAALG